MFLNQLGSNIVGKYTEDYFGAAVSLSSNGTIIAIGAYDSGFNSGGYARLYEWDGSSWNQIGSEINEEFLYDYFGSSVSLMRRWYYRSHWS